MTHEAGHFLPDRLRPQDPGKRSRRGLALLSVVPCVLLAFPFWKIADVRVDECPRLPRAAVDSLETLVGQPALGFDVAGVKESVEIWPGVGEVQVDFLLPGTVIVRAKDAEALGSVKVGRSWHGVDAEGSLTGRIDEPVRPVLEGFSAAADRRLGLGAALRVREASGARVLRMRRITPRDYRVELQRAQEGLAAVIHVRPAGTVAEQRWCRAFASGAIAQSWADLRWSDRMVVGGGE